MGKDLFKVQIRSMNFIVEEYEKFVAIFLDFTLKLNFRKLPCVTFW